MNLTPLQERRLKQVEDDIAFFQKEIQKKGIWFALRLSWITVMLVYISTYFFELLFENKSLPAYVNEYGWVKIITGWIFWFLVDYFFIVKENHRNLRRKKKELAELKEKYKLAKETVS